MKRIYSMGKNKYVHMDSYCENHETHPVADLLMALFVIGIASMTAGAIVGIDITSITAPTHETTRSSDR